MRKKIKNLLKQVIERLPVSNTQVVKSSKHPHIKNRPQYDVEMLSMKYFGVNLLTVEGIGENTVMTFISEIGTDILKFPTKKNFTRWPMYSGWQPIPSLKENLVFLKKSLCA